MDELHYQMDLLKAMNQKLSNDEHMYRMLCNTSDMAYVYFSYASGRIMTLGKWKEMFHFSVNDQRDLSGFYDIVDEAYVGELGRLLFADPMEATNTFVECLHKNKKNWLLFRSTFVYDDNLVLTDRIISICDVTKNKSQSEELTYFAYYDTITGLYNRNYFVCLLGDWLKKAQEENEIISVMMIDIDDFHKINDGMGMVVGDEVVQQLGSFLKDFNNDKIISCHLNSDVYCMAIYKPDNNCNPETIHRSIKNRTKAPFYLSGGQEIRLTVSIGVAEYPEAAQSALDLINCSEIVMLKCKALGKNAIQYFDASTLKDFRFQVEIENQLKDAVINKNFELYYQPQYYAGNKELRGAEVLIRWKRADQQNISPALFIPIAEKNGAILNIGSWVIEQSIKQYSVWKSRYSIEWILSINISAKQFSQDNFVLDIIRILEKYHVKPECIELEITESILIEDFASVSRKLQILKSNGIRISLDDFGTNFSSLSYLKKLPINTLKIDKSFIDTLLTDYATRVITESIIDMVKALGFESIAEGVEEEQQYRYLHAIGCDVIQGYYFSKPVCSSDLEKLIQELQ